MKILQDMLDSEIQGESFTRRMIARTIHRRLQRLGFRIDNDFLSVIESRLQQTELKDLTLQFEDEQIPEEFLKRQRIEAAKPNLDLSGLERELNEIVEELYLLNKSGESRKFLPKTSCFSMS